MSFIPAAIRRFLTPIIALSVILPATASAQAPEADPAILPQGPLGEQIAWLVETLNTDPATYTPDELAAHFAPVFLASVPAGQLPLLFTQLQQQLGPSRIEPGPMMTTRDMPPTNARFVLIGDTGLRVLVTLNVDRDSGLIDGFFVAPAPAPLSATPAASPAPETGVSDIAVTFQSGDDTIYGAYMAPAGTARPQYAAIIISGSGPTDRDGNSGHLTAMDTNLNIATVLADSGVPSLRYDKLGSGETGLASHDPSDPVGVEVFLQEARDAVAFTADQAGVAPGQVILIGHSEGALFALLLAQEMVEAGTPPAGVILASPLSLRYLDVIVDQVSRQYEAAAVAGAMTRDAADAGIAELDAIRDSLRETGALPDQPLSAAIAPLFAPANIPFLVEIDRHDPAAIAASLPADLPVLILHGGKDQQVFPEHIAHLMTGFANHDAVTLVEIPDANHLLKTIEGEPNAAVDYANPDLPFAPDAIAALETFIATLD